MVTEVDELLHIRERVDALCLEMNIAQRPELGVMIEVPAAALLAEQLAEYADFLSIGTNDLSQYTLAMDRDHAGLAARVDALHPALLRLIAMTCEGAAVHKRWVGVCGALASDPLATPVLIGLGVSELSVSPVQIGEIKDRVRQVHEAECQRISQRPAQAEQRRRGCATPVINIGPAPALIKEQQGETPCTNTSSKACNASAAR
jgi:phosphoenolpyruvate-protein kinase (PTS system EI component)